ncbi:MAG: sterol-binding protein, partial [Xanthomonadales bacterium]|nr:sterol-binding protein [Xanthomonadales bacterium]
MPNSPDAAPRAPNPILAALGRALEGVLNRALALDPDTRTALGPLDGRALGMTFEGTGLALRIGVDGERLRVGPAFAGARDLDIAA